MEIKNTFNLANFSTKENLFSFIQKLEEERKKFRQINCTAWGWRSKSAEKQWWAMWYRISSLYEEHALFE